MTKAETTPTSGEPMSGYFMDVNKLKGFNKLPVCNFRCEEVVLRQEETVQFESHLTHLHKNGSSSDEVQRKPEGRLKIRIVRKHWYYKCCTGTCQIRVYPPYASSILDASGLICHTCMMFSKSLCDVHNLKDMKNSH